MNELLVPPCFSDRIFLDLSRVREFEAPKDGHLFLMRI